MFLPPYQMLLILTVAGTEKENRQAVLNLKNFRQQIPQFMKKTKEHWTYTEICINIIAF
jgi:hypothetical protein